MMKLGIDMTVPPNSDISMVRPRNLSNLRALVDGMKQTTKEPKLPPLFENKLNVGTRPLHR